MTTIELKNPFFEEYIQNIGKEELEKMFLSFLKIKTKSKEDISTQKLKELGISKKVHNKIMALKVKPKKNSKEMIELRKEIGQKMKAKYGNKSIDKIREEYFDSKKQ